MNEDGTLKVEKINAIDELTDEDFSNPTRNVQLPALPQNVDNAIGANGKPVVIKKNIFGRNSERHGDLTPEDSRKILTSALYRPDLYGNNQKKKRPLNWVVINTKDEEGNNRLVLLEVNENKDNIEIVHWYYLDERGLEKIKRQAANEDGQLLILPSEKTEEVGALSDPIHDLSSTHKDTPSTPNSQAKKSKNNVAKKDKAITTSDLFPKVDNSKKLGKEISRQSAVTDKNVTLTRIDYENGYVCRVENKNGDFVEQAYNADGTPMSQALYNIGVDNNQFKEFIKQDKNGLYIKDKQLFEVLMQNTGKENAKPKSGTKKSVPKNEESVPKNEENAPKNKESKTKTKKSLRQHKAEQAQAATTEDTARRDALTDLMQQSGLEVFVDEKAQQVLDEVNGNGAQIRLQAMIKGLNKASNFILSVLKGQTKQRKAKIEIPEIANRLAEKTLKHPINSHSINANEIVHIKKRHGENGTANNSNSIPLRDEDISLMPYIMAAPTKVVKGSTAVNGTESVRYEKELENGYVVVVEREGRFDVEDMENITMWAQKKPATNVTVATRTSHSTSETIVISETDVAKIKKDAEDAIRKEEKLREHLVPVKHGDLSDAEITILIEHIKKRSDSIATESTEDIYDLLRKMSELNYNAFKGYGSARMGRNREIYLVKQNVVPKIANELLSRGEYVGYDEISGVVYFNDNFGHQISYHGFSREEPFSSDLRDKVDYNAKWDGIRESWRSDADIQTIKEREKIRKQIQNEINDLKQRLSDLYAQKKSDKYNQPPSFYIWENNLRNAFEHVLDGFAINDQDEVYFNWFIEKSEEAQKLIHERSLINKRIAKLYKENPNKELEELSKKLNRLRKPESIERTRKEIKELEKQKNDFYTSLQALERYRNENKQEIISVYQKQRAIELQKIKVLSREIDAKIEELEKQIDEVKNVELPKLSTLRFFRTPGGEAYGFTVNGKIYLDPRIATAETAIHEYAHLWADMLRQMNPEAWNDIVQLMKGTSVWDEVKSLYPELKTDDEIADEVLAHYSGRQGAAKLREEHHRIAHDQNMDLRSKATAIAALERIKQALTKFWKGVADLLHIRFTTAEEVADRILADLLHGVNPTAYAKREDGKVREQLTSEKETGRKEEETGDTTLLNVDGNPVVVKAEDGSVELNYRTWQEEKEQVRMALEDGGLETEAVDAIMAQAEVVAEAVQAMSKTYPIFGVFQNKEAGKQPILRNTGEYLSWDYSFNCVKKDALNAVVEMMVSQGKAAHLGITQMEALKKLLQKHGFLTPCVMCYVEAKRKVYKQSKEASDKWNAVAEAAGLSADKIGKRRELTAEQKQILMALSEGKELERVANLAVKDGEGIKADTIKKMAKLMLLSPELRGRMAYADLMSPSSFSAMYNQLAHTGLMEFLTQGQSRGKSLMNAVPFSLNNIPRDLFYEIYNPVKLANIGGLRQFSYEDARAMMFFDYYQQFMLMQGARALEHLYTKRPFMPEMFGRTGAMMNQSLIVDIFKGADWHHEALGLDNKAYDRWLRDNAGFVPTGALPETDSRYREGGMELVPYYSVESFPVDIAMQNVHNPDYKSCVGNTIVAPSVKFIQWALDNPEIHMILAYHAAGANPVMKSLTGYDLATGMDDGYHTKKDGKAIDNLYVPEIGLEIAGKSLQWNQLLRKNGYDARKAAQVYLDYCKENGLTPMFNYEGVVDMSGDKAVSHPNYYKLLTDFRVYDDNGKPIRQRSVKMELPDNWQEILGRYLKQEQQSGEAVANITLDESLKKEIENVTRYASMEPGERSTFIGLLTDIYGKDNVTVCNTETFYKMLEELSNGEFSDTLRNRNGMVYGFAQGEKIVLNEDLFNAHTPMHEHTHIYMKVLQATNPRLYARGMELWRNTPLWNEARRGLEILGETPTDEKIFSECMAQFTGSENEKIISEVTGITDKNWIKKALSWIQEMWQGVKSSFSRWTGKDLKGLTAEQFASMPVRAIYDAKERQVYKSKLEQYKQAMEAIGRDAAGVDGHITLKEDLKAARSSNGAVLYREGEKINEQQVLSLLKQRVIELFRKALSKEFTGKPISIGRLSVDGKKYLEKLSGLKFKEFVDFVLNPSDLNHIHSDHYGQNEKDKGNNVPLTDQDIQNMVEVLNKPDAILYGVDKKDGRKLFFFLKDAGNGLYNLTEVCSTKKGNLTAKSFFKSKKKGISQRVMEIKDSLLPTSVTYSGEFLSSEAKIPKLFEINEIYSANVVNNGIMFREGQELNSSPITEAANRTAGSLHLDNVTILGEQDLASLTPKQRSAKGWFDPKTGRIYINASNHANEADVVQTVLHEAVAHFGLRALFGKDFDTMLDRVYRAAGSEIHIPAHPHRVQQPGTANNRLLRQNHLRPQFQG